MVFSRNILWIIFFIILFLVTTYIPQAYFLPGIPFQADTTPVGKVVLSYIPLTCWVLLIAGWIGYWKNKSHMNFPRVSLFTLIFFFAVYVICNYLFYNFRITCAEGDAISNMALSMTMGSGKSPYIPWTTACGFGRQTLFYVIFIPYFILKGPDTLIPVKILLFSNFVSIVCFYFFLRTLKICKPVAYLIFISLMIKPALIVWQGMHYPQQLTPAFEFLNLLFFYKSIMARKRSDNVGLKFWTAMLGLSVGVGYNLYDLNYLFGTGIVFLYIFTMVALFFTMKDSSTGYFFLITLVLFISIAFGTGPLLGYFMKYPWILWSRLQVGTIETQALAEFIKQLKAFGALHWGGALSKYWMSKLAFILLVPGIILSFFKKPRYFWFGFWMLTVMLFLLFILSGRFGKRRIVSIIFFEYTFIAIMLNVIMRKFFNLETKLIRIAATILLITIFSGTIFLDAIDSMGLINSYQETQFRNPARRAISVYSNFIKQFSNRKNIIFIEPKCSHASIFWTGGRPNIYNLMDNNFRFYRTNKTFVLLPITLKKFLVNKEPFGFVFFLKDEYRTSLTHMRPADMEKNFDAVKKLEKLFLKIIESYGIENFTKVELDHKNKLLVRAYIWE